MLKDPRVRSIYIGTKVVVFVLAALATWPLARVIGPKAWVGLGVFGFVLTLLTLVVVFGGSVRASSPPPPRDELEDEESFDPEQPVTIPTEDFLDLHPFAPREIPDVVEAYLEAAADKGFSEVRLIHGKGIGVQRERVQKLLAKHPLVSSYRDAPAERGGWGATIAWLEKPTDS
jgi:hypothetical protein